ncbi:MAG: prepilin peptidase, partial [Rubripirellula sp.]
MFDVIAIVVFSLLAFATSCDFRTREIPDWVSITIALIAFVGSVSGWLGLTLPWVALGGLAGLSTGYV